MAIISLNAIRFYLGSIQELRKVFKILLPDWLKANQSEFENLQPFPKHIFSESDQLEISPTIFFFLISNRSLIGRSFSTNERLEIIPYDCKSIEARSRSKFLILVRVSRCGDEAQL